MEMLLNKNTGVISVDGDVSVGTYENDFYVNVVGEEVEVEGGFKLVAKDKDGNTYEAFLSVEDYFGGKEFTIDTSIFDKRSLGEKVIEVLNKDEEAKNLIKITKETMVEKGYEINGEDWQEVMQTMLMLCIKNNDEAYEVYTRHIYEELRKA